MKTKQIAVTAAIAVLGIAILVSATTYWSEFLVMQENRIKPMEYNTAIGSPILGSETATVTILEYGDYQCEMCKHWFHNTRSQIIENYVDSGKVNLYFMDIPFLGRDSAKAANASYCAEEQGMYWEYHSVLYEHQEDVDDGWASPERLKSFAFSLGLDSDQFSECIDLQKYKQRVKLNSDKSVSQGVQSTPYFVITNSDGEQQKISGAQPYSVFRQVIESML